MTQSTLTTKESPSGKVVPPSGRASLATKRPTKFAPYASTRSLDAILPRERSVERQLASLSLTQRSCVDALKIKWESQNRVDRWFSDDYYLRFARCSPGHPFNFRTAWKVMARFDWRYYELSITKMEAKYSHKGKMMRLCACLKAPFPSANNTCDFSCRLRFRCKD